LTPLNAKENTMPQLCRLKTKALIDGAVRDPGYVFTLPDGVRGPHRAVAASHDRIDYDIANGIDANRILPTTMDEPLYDVLDEEHEKRVAELSAKHQQELAEHDGTLARDEMVRRHSEESAALRAEGTKREIDLRHKANAEKLAARHKAEVEAFERKPAPLVVPPPKETTAEDLRARHEAEAEELAEVQKREVEAFEAAHAPKDEPQAEAEIEPEPGETPPSTAAFGKKPATPHTR
jgi:hypothetical protein